MTDYIIVAVVLIILVSIIVRSVVRHKKGINNDCGCGCGGCSNNSCGHEADK